QVIGHGHSQGTTVACGPIALPHGSRCRLTVPHTLGSQVARTFRLIRQGDTRGTACASRPTAPCVLRRSPGDKGPFIGNQDRLLGNRLGQGPLRLVVAGVGDLDLHTILIGAPGLDRDIEETKEAVFGRNARGQLSSRLWYSGFSACQLALRESSPRAPAPGRGGPARVCGGGNGRRLW